MKENVKLMEIRRPNGLEYQKILLLTPQAIHDGTMGGSVPTDVKVKQLVEPLLEKGSYYLIATEDGTLMGWILIGSSKDQFTEKAYGFIYELFVMEEFRGKGISKKLMATATQDFERDGYSEARLSVYAGNQAIKLYEKMGYENRTITMSMPIKSNSKLK